MTSGTTWNRKLRFWIGGICAAALPISIGLFLFIFPKVLIEEASCYYGADNITNLCRFYLYFGEDFYGFIMLPIILSFVFVAPLVAAMCAAELWHMKPMGWRHVFSTSLNKSTQANMCVAAIYDAIWILFLVISSLTVGVEAFSYLVMFLLILATMQLGLWLTLTLPLSLICAGLFGLIVNPSLERRN